MKKHPHPTCPPCRRRPVTWRPRLDRLEDRLPPGDVLLGQWLGWPLAGAGLVSLSPAFAASGTASAEAVSGVPRLVGADTPSASPADQSSVGTAVALPQPTPANEPIALPERQEAAGRDATGTANTGATSAVFPGLEGLASAFDSLSAAGAAARRHLATSGSGAPISLADGLDHGGTSGSISVNRAASVPPSFAPTVLTVTSQSTSAVVPVSIERGRGPDPTTITRGLPPAPQQIITPFTVANVIPNSQSGETDQNSETSVAVNPNNQTQALVSSFNNNPGVNPQPYFLTNGTNGLIWTQPAQITHEDTTTDWSRNNILYTSRLFNNGNDLDVQNSSPPIPVNFNQIAGSVINAATPVDPDQPWIKVDSVTGGADRIYVAFNDVLAAHKPQTASIHYSLDSGATWDASNGNKPVPIDRINHGGAAGADRDAASVRVAPARIGNQVYAVFEAYLGFADGTGTSADRTAQIYVVRDNLAGTNNFKDLGPMGMGVNVLGGANTVTVPVSLGGIATGTALGHERLGSDLSIAVDPGNPNRVFVAYAQVVGGKSQIQVQLSTDAGATWNPVPLLSVTANSALPALAVAKNGAVGMLYTELDNANNLETRFVQAPADLSFSLDSLLTFFPDNNPMPVPTVGPYIGDYQDLVAVGNTFFGSFAASNNPNTANFPQGAFFQRSFNDPTGAAHPNGGFLQYGQNALVDAAGMPVNVSIDPYLMEVNAFGPCAGTFNGGLPAGWSGKGNFGTSAAVKDVNPTCGPNFAYLQTNFPDGTQTGGNPTGVPTAFTGVPFATSGSILTSAGIAINANQQIAVDLGFLTNDGGGFADFGYAELVDTATGNTVATLFAGDTDGFPFANETYTNINPDLVTAGHGQTAGGVNLGFSPGVTITGAGLFDGNAAGPIAGQLFGPGKYPDNPALPPDGAGPGGFSSWVTAAFTVSKPSTYALNFVVSNLIDEIYPSGMVVGDVRVTDVTPIGGRGGPGPDHLTPALPLKP